MVKSTNINVACRFFARTPSRILRMVKKKKKKKKKKPTKTNCPLHPTRPPPKLPKISVVNKSPDEEEHLNSGAKWKKYVNIGQYVFNSNLKC